MKPAKSLADLKQRLTDVDTIVAGDTGFTAVAILFLAEQQAEQARLLDRQILASTELAQAASALVQALSRKQAKGAPTLWQVFFGKGIKAGLTPAQVAAKWRARKS